LIDGDFSVTVPLCLFFVGCWVGGEDGVSDGDGAGSRRRFDLVPGRAGIWTGDLHVPPHVFPNRQSFAVHPKPFLALSRTGVPKDEERLNIPIPIISCTSSFGTPGRGGNLFPGRDVHRHAAFFADKPAS